jgi:hypothetical protein
MAITSNGTGGGLASATSTWAGGVVPTNGVAVVIAATDTVTLDSTFTWGDDSTTAITINGILKASRTSSSSLTVKGNIFTASTTTATLDYGTQASPIPAGVTATMVLNYSAALAINKYTLFIANLSNFFAQGYQVQKNTTLNSGIAAAATSMIVADATGWAVGDKLVIAETDGNIAHEDVVTLTGVTPGSGTTATVTFAAITYAHAAGCPVGHFSSNVTFKAYSNTYGMCIATSENISTAANTRGLQYVHFDYHCNLSGTGAQSIISAASGGLLTWAIFDSCSFFGSVAFVNAAQLSITGKNSGQNISNLAIYNAAGVFGMYHFGAYYGIHTGIVFYRTSIALLSSNSQGVFNNCKFWAVSAAGLSLQMSIGFVFNSCQWHFSSTYFASLQLGFATFNTCNFGYSSLPGSPAANYLLNKSFNSLMPSVFNNCQFKAAFGTANYQNLNLANPADTTLIVNKNADVTQQSLWTPQGEWSRDNSTIKNSTSSMMLLTKTASISSYSFLVNAANGVPITISGNLQYNAAYIAAGYTLPTVTISGLGITPVVFTAASASSGSWQRYVLTATQTSGAAGQLTVTLSGQSATTTGAVWFDGLDIPPFVTNCRFYGYIEDQVNPLRTVNPYTVLSEAAAGALTGIAINGATGLITVSSAHSAQDVEDYSEWWASQSSNIGYALPISHSDAVNGIINPGYKLAISNYITFGSKRWSGGKLTFTTATTYSPKIGITALEFSAASGTYDLTGADINGTVTLTNIGGGNITVHLPAATSYVNTGPNITVDLTVHSTVTFTGFPAGSDVVVLTAGTTTELTSVNANATTSWSWTYAGTLTVDVGFFLQGYKPTYLRGLVLPLYNSTVPVNVPIDRTYL